MGSGVKRWRRQRMTCLILGVRFEDFVWLILRLAVEQSSDLYIWMFVFLVVFALGPCLDALIILYLASAVSQGAKKKKEAPNTQICDLNLCHLKT